jgi:hypothetical protein
VSWGLEYMKDDLAAFTGQLDSLLLAMGDTSTASVIDRQPAEAGVIEDTTSTIGASIVESDLADPTIDILTRTTKTRPNETHQHFSEHSSDTRHEEQIPQVCGWMD